MAAALDSFTHKRMCSCLEMKCEIMFMRYSGESVDVFSENVQQLWEHPHENIS